MMRTGGELVPAPIHVDVSQVVADAVYATVLAISVALAIVVAVILLAYFLRVRDEAHQDALRLHVSDEARSLVAAGQQIQAIKQLRADNDGASLDAAKRAVSRLGAECAGRDRTMDSAPPTPPASARR